MFADVFQSGSSMLLRLLVLSSDCFLVTLLIELISYVLIFLEVQDPPDPFIINLCIGKILQKEFHF